MLDNLKDKEVKKLIKLLLLIKNENYLINLQSLDIYYHNYDNEQ